MNLKQLAEAAQARGIEDIELYKSHAKTTSMRVYDQAVDSFTISESNRWKIKGAYQSHMGKVMVEDFSEATIPFILDGIIENATAITSEDEQELYAGDKEYPVVEYTENRCLSESSAKKAELLKSLEQKLLHSDDRIVQVMEVAYEDVEGGVTIQNTKGLDVQREDTISMLVASILVKDGDDQKSAFDIITLKDLESFDQDQFVAKLKEKAVKKLHARQVPSGHYPVLIEKTAMADLLRQVFNQFHGENGAKGISLLKDSLNQKIFDEKVSIIDDPLRKDGYNSAPFDDEGVACKQHTIVEHGVFTSFLHNLKSAKLMQTASTGNGFSGDIVYTNYYMASGDTTYEDMIKTMKQGVIITELSGLHAGWNTITTQFSLQASGFYVENGEIAYPVNLITIAGNFLELMKDVELIGNDLEFSYTGVGSPSVLFPSIAVSGE